MAALVLAAVFGYAALSKAIRSSAWVDSLDAYGIRRWTPVVAWGVPISEAIVATLLAMGAERTGGLAAFVLLAGFSFAIARTRSRRLPCACFGGRSEWDRRLLLARNALLTVLSIIVALWPGLFVEAPSGRDVIPALSVLVGVVAAVLTVMGARSALRRLE